MLIIPPRRWAEIATRRQADYYRQEVKNFLLLCKRKLPAALRLHFESLGQIGGA